MTHSGIEDSCQRLGHPRMFTYHQQKNSHYIFYLIMAVLFIQFYHIFNSLTGGIFHFDLPVPKSLFYFIFDI